MYPETHCDEICENDNAIIGLGDSFTQGVGAYSIETWNSIPNNPNSYNVSGQLFIEEQGKNNWVRQIRDNFLPNYKVFNLGVNGAGNRAAIKELYLNPLPEKLGNVIVILMATGLERFDLLKQSDDTAGKNWHQKWQTIWPTNSDRGPISKVEHEYLYQIWSPRNDAIEFLLNVADAQSFCKARGYTFLFASAFDEHISKDMLIRKLESKRHLIDMVDWQNFISPAVNRKAFMDMIHQLENPYRNMPQIFAHYASLKMPTKYVTPCSHWTIDGQSKVAEYLYNELLQRQLI